jgi:HTH-type transcriptional regulator/antitoxin HipB
MALQPKLGYLVRYVRIQAGISQIELAQYAGVGKTVVFDLEKGKETIQLDTLCKILAVLNITIEIKTPIPVEEDKQ